MQKIQVKAGTYFIGDPALCLSSETWDKLVDQTEDFKQQSKDIVAFKAKTTKSEFTDNQHNRYVCHTGILGLVPIDKADGQFGGRQLRRFSRSFNCWEENGVIHLGCVSIHTEEEACQAMA